MNEAPKRGAELLFAVGEKASGLLQVYSIFFDSSVLILDQKDGGDGFRLIRSLTQEIDDEVVRSVHLLGAVAGVWLILSTKDNLVHPVLFGKDFSGSVKFADSNRKASKYVVEVRGIDKTVDGVRIVSITNTSGDWNQNLKV